jgi:hypothetical protein
VSEIATAEHQDELTPVSWEPQGELDFEEWRAVGRKLARIARASRWWLGDWLNYGEKAYGGKYTQALRQTGYDYQSLADMARVSKEFDVSRRRENLSWSHHEEVAALEPSEQDRMLDQAATHGWSQKALRAEIGGHGNAARTREQPTLTARVTFEAEFANQQLLRQTVATLRERAEELGFTVCKA